MYATTGHKVILHSSDDASSNLHLTPVTVRQSANIVQSGETSLYDLVSESINLLDWGYWRVFRNS
jgi:hypothetical protein